MNHLRALDANLEPVDVDQGEYHSGPQCAICHEVDCSNCGNFDTEECPGIDPCRPEDSCDPEERGLVIEQLHRYAALADRIAADLTTEKNLRLLAERAAKRQETAWANASRAHALAEAAEANAVYREKLALAELAKLQAELIALRNAEPA